MGFSLHAVFRVGIPLTPEETAWLMEVFPDNLPEYHLRADIIYGYTAFDWSVIRGDSSDGMGQDGKEPVDLLQVKDIGHSSYKGKDTEQIDFSEYLEELALLADHYEEAWGCWVQNLPEAVPLYIYHHLICKEANVKFWDADDMSVAEVHADKKARQGPQHAKGLMQGRQLLLDLVLRRKLVLVKYIAMA